MKKKKMILILEQNYEEILKEVLRQPEIEFLVLTVFFRTSIQEGYEFLKKLQRTFGSHSILLLSDIEYLANDLEIAYVLELKNIYDFPLENFMNVYENSIQHYSNLTEFLTSVSDLYHFTFNTYNAENPWFYTFQNKGILMINDRNYLKILQNYHKIKLHTSDLIFINLNEEGVENNLKLLKMLGSDSHITFGCTNNLKSKFSQYIDVIIHNRSPYYEKNIQNFIHSIFEKYSWEIGLKKLRLFFDIDEKSFEADLWEEEEEIIKPGKRFFLKNKNTEDILDEKKYFFIPNKHKETILFLEKDENFHE